ncbi:hypothetical protein N7495_000526 [Penicillium taxi]|uniref:uncharacterized protein n=1 Tax=Penicillium taxi TaxID=168475 RepID=UPI00254556EF|nr:uncharacterized protein N7495_000526 [Penicillium taxi]KAJ5907844.1 hypothetical protein N7495_000526 [Penicillium taxi]
MPPPDPDTPPDQELSAEEQLMIDEMVADLGTRRREYVSTCDEYQADPNVTLRSIDASRQSNVPGTYAAQQFEVNQESINAWRNFGELVKDMEDRDNLESIMDGQSHRAGLLAKERGMTSLGRGAFSARSMRGRAPVRGAHQGRGSGAIGTRGRGGTHKYPPIPCKDPSLERNFNPDGSQLLPYGGRGGVQQFPRGGRHRNIDDSVSPRSSFLLQADRPRAKSRLVPPSWEGHIASPSDFMSSFNRKDSTNASAAEKGLPAPTAAPNVSIGPKEYVAPTAFVAPKGSAAQKASPAPTESRVSEASDKTQSEKTKAMIAVTVKTMQDNALDRNSVKAKAEENVTKSRTPPPSEVQPPQGNLLEMTPPSVERRNVAGLPLLSPGMQTELTGLSISFTTALMEQVKTATEDQIKTVTDSQVQTSIVKSVETSIEAHAEKEPSPPVARTSMSRSQWEMQVLQLSNGLHRLMETRPLDFIDTPLDTHVDVQSITSVFAQPITPTHTGMYAARAPEHYHDSTSSSGGEKFFDTESPSPCKVHSQICLPEFSKLRISDSSSPTQLVIEGGNSAPQAAMELPAILFPSAVEKADNSSTRAVVNAAPSTVVKLPGTLTPSLIVKTTNSSPGLVLKSPSMLPPEFVPRALVANSPTTTSNGIAIGVQAQSGPVKAGGLNASRYATVVPPRGISFAGNLPFYPPSRTSPYVQSPYVQVTNGTTNNENWNPHISDGFMHPHTNSFGYQGAPATTIARSPAIIDEQGRHDPVNPNGFARSRWATASNAPTDFSTALRCVDRGGLTDANSSTFVRPRPYAPIRIVSPTEANNGNRDVGNHYAGNVHDHDHARNLGL